MGVPRGKIGAIKVGHLSFKETAKVGLVKLGARLPQRDTGKLKLGKL